MPAPAPVERPIPALHLAQTPAWVRRVGRLLLFCLLALPFVLLTVPWVQTVVGQGRVAAYAPLDRQQSIEAPIDGRVTRWYVREGSEVKEGDLLAEVSDNDPQLIARLEQQIEAAKLKLLASEAKVGWKRAKIQAIETNREQALAAAQERLNKALQDVEAAQQDLQAAESAKATARLNYDRQKALAEDGLASTRKYELARLKREQTEAKVLQAIAKLEAAKADANAKRADMSAYAAEFESKLSAARAELEVAQGEVATSKDKVAETEIKQARQNNQKILAPADGTVLRLRANRGGEFVSAGDPLMVLVPATNDLAVELWVDGNDMPLLRPGSEVRLQFEGWPAVQFAGWPSVSVGTFGGRVQLVDATDDGSGRFRVVILPDPAEPSWPSRHYLRQGVRAKGWILLQQVTLGYELWRQINGFPPALDPPPPLLDNEVPDKKPKKKKKEGK